MPNLTIPCSGSWGAAEPIASNNWSADYPYAPQVTFCARHDDQNLYLKFNIQESCTKADVTEDNGRVWTDSCVEFFVSFDDSGYYNFEFTCIGKMLLAFRKEKPSPTPASADVLALIKRESSLGTANFAERKGENNWTLEVKIPKEAFFKHKIDSLKGFSATANFYKCGDELSKPHFLSWAPIGVEQPNFHLPKYFGNIHFE